MKNIRFHIPSFFFGVVLSLALGVSLTDRSSAGAFDVGKLGNIGKIISKSVKSLTGLKKNLDKDVRNLTADAKILIADKNNLKKIKEQLMKLATETRAQIDSVAKLVNVVDTHLRKTKADIDTTAKHVKEIDKIKKSLSK